MSIEIVIHKLLNCKKSLSLEQRLIYGSFFTPRFIHLYCNQLLNQKLVTFLEKRKKPDPIAIGFIEEEIISVQEVWEKHVTFLNQCMSLNEEDTDKHICHFFNTISFIEVLVILGQRFTPASEKTDKALPPPDKLLKESAMELYNTEIKIAVRAWEKHVGRNATEFWGEIKGNPLEREKRVELIIDRIFEDCSWWNVFTHYKHGLVYEIRASSGHGLRWQLNRLRFIGFVEPFINE